MLALALMLAASCSAMYLPGVTQNDYLRSSPVDLKVVKLDSTQTLLPYRYYQLPFCSPSVVRDMIDNLGEILVGDRIENSPFQLFALENVKCKRLCVRKYDAAQMEKFRSFIAEVGFSPGFLIRTDSFAGLPRALSG